MNSRRVVLCLGALLSALLAFSASASAKSTPTPVIKSISPMTLKVGEKLTIKGKNFLPGKNKTRVFFVRKSGGTAFARAEKATKTKLVVTLPAQLDKVLDGKTVRVQVRVLTKKFGKLTAAKKSPLVSPSVPGTIEGPDPGVTGPGSAAGDCDKDGVPNSEESDMDNDLLSNDDEKTLGLDPCAADTDLDGVEDGYEWFSALDLNRTVLFGERPPTPYPAKRPYPNPLFADAEVDYDGEGLSLGQEHALWQTYGGHATPLNYSDGLQTTVATPLPPDEILQQLDAATAGSHYNDGMLDDGERDADGDNLSNWDEFNGSMNQSWWTEQYKDEKEYPLTYSGTQATDPDTDGDGVLDGDDDQDHDGLSNAFEVRRPWNWSLTYISVNGDTPHDGTDGQPNYQPNAYARVQPFNPCKPVYSETCHRHPPFGYYNGEDWAGLNPADAGAPGVTPGPMFP
jgi:IPT/TIG domain-containing protein